MQAPLALEVPIYMFARSKDTLLYSVITIWSYQAFKPILRADVDAMLFLAPIHRYRFCVLHMLALRASLSYAPAALPAKCGLVRVCQHCRRLGNQFKYILFNSRSFSSYLPWVQAEVLDHQQIIRKLKQLCIVLYHRFVLFVQVLKPCYEDWTVDTGECLPINKWGVPPEQKLWNTLPWLRVIHGGDSIGHSLCMDLNSMRG